uniref:CUB domain-containing protein n=1 Tax=Crocodylus porosus TaxID=8502 RepID=A0A7M4ESJ9_CROPO
SLPETPISCGGFLTRSSGVWIPTEISGSDLAKAPFHHFENVKCCITLTLFYSNMIISIHSLGDSYNCLSDYIEVYDGPLYTSPLLGKICDGSDYSFTSTSNTMTVLFSSVSDYSAGRFSAYYYSVPENNNDTGRLT